MRALHHYSRQILQLDPEHRDAWFLISIAAGAAGQMRKAVEMVERALHSDPQNAEYLTQKARYCAQLNDYKSAIQAADAALAASPNRPLLLDTLGVVYARFDEHHKAIAPLRGAVAQAPHNPQFQFNLASTEQFLGNIEAARTAYQKAIELQPGFARAHWALSELGKNSTGTGDTDKLNTLLQQPQLSAEDQLYFSHALARNLEQRGDYSQAFQCLNNAKQRYRKKIGYTFSQDATLFGAVKSAFASPATNRATGLGRQFLFIVGMPRSGTTLVERILASHSRVESLGELHEFPLVVKQHSNTDHPRTLDEQVISGALEQPPNSIGQAYEARCLARGKSADYLIDKLPMNFLYLGFILRSLPEAKIVVLDRHPLDVCLSNFRQLFSFNFRYYHYHYSLEDTARYICAYKDLMSHWKTVYGNRIHTVNYEQLTETPRQEAGELLQHIGLPWEESCLAFHQSNAPVSTASSVQIRQPIYRDSVKRWKRFEKELTPAIDIFNQTGVL